jgi:CheY-like chemotaxis protein
MTLHNEPSESIKNMNLTAIDALKNRAHLQLNIDKDEKLLAAEKVLNEDISQSKVLVVEDNQINAIIVQKFIANWGGQSQHAWCGEQAIEMLKSERFSLVLMDLQMPDMDGYETTKIIRSFLPNIPIIALSADAMLETRTTALKMGMSDYITKPFNPNELKKIIQLYCKYDTTEEGR